MNRRKLFKFAAGGTGALLASTAGASALCMTPTKAQTEGPFYPKDWTEYEADADMTKLVNSEALANGQLSIVKGQVIDFQTCEPVANAQVDVWQANAFGQYFHESDASAEELKDKNFQYRCRIITDAEGRFSFKTIKPSPYPAGGSWIRPPHIHYKVISDSHHELTTQMYFEGDPLNQNDRILQGMSNSQKDSVTVSFKENQSKILEGEFTIALRGK
ncbi:MAG: hypothetical protein ACRBBP_06120 [Bdellovibrionales bacterium]